LQWGSCLANAGDRSYVVVSANDRIETPTVIDNGRYVMAGTHVQGYEPSKTLFSPSDEGAVKGLNFGRYRHGRHSTSLR
jgi:hypothetical protein